MRSACSHLKTSGFQNQANKRPLLVIQAWSIFSGLPRRFSWRRFQSRLPSQRIKSLFIFVWLDEADIVIFWYLRPDPTFYILIYNNALCQFLTNVLLALRTVVQPLFYDTWPHRAAIIDQFRIIRHTTIAENLRRRQPEAEVFIPPVTQLLLV
jgi:hypothetical protein